MGGNLFKTETNTKRISKKEFNDISNDIASKFLSLGIKRFSFLKSVGEKSDFGDIDILLDSTYNLDFDKISKMFSTKFVKKTGEGHSFVYKSTQVDLIYVDWKDIDTLKIFYDWNDCGNIIGRLAKSHYCSFKKDGLYLKLYNDKRNKILETFLLTKKVEDIFDLLDLNYTDYKKGFDTFENMFIWASKSKYFNAKFFYDREFVKGDDIRRDMKRPTYLKFLEYFTHHPSKNEYQRKPFSEVIDILDKKFKDVHLKDKIDKIQKQEVSDKEFSEKWNGRIISTYTGLTEIKLGNFIKWSKTKMKSKEEILKMDDKEIKKEIISLWNEWKFTKEALKN